MTSFLGNANLSILSIPVFYAMAILPHTYAITLQGKNWDNRNPRSSTYKQSLEKKLGPELFARYERAEAASANALENVPLFAAAVIVGNIAGLKQSGINGLNGFVGVYLAARVVHTLVYINNTSESLALVRSGAYFGSFALAVRVFYQAAVAMGSRGLGL